MITGVGETDQTVSVGTSGANPAGSRILARRRRELIAAHVQRHGSARVSDLTSELGVSDMTIRRDLDALTREGIVNKVHGGATLPPTTWVEPGFAAKSAEQIDEKRAIAASAARMVHAGSAIGLTAGTTTWRLAEALASVADLMVVTNSIRICETLLATERSDLTVVLTGGMRTPSDALVGPIAVQSLSSLHLDQVFMGVHGMTERAGFTTPNMLEADTNQAFVAAAAHLVVLADHTKWNTVGLASIAPLSAANTVVSDGGLDHPARLALSAHVVNVVLADPA